MLILLWTLITCGQCTSVYYLRLWVSKAYLTTSRTSFSNLAVRTSFTIKHMIVLKAVVITLKSLINTAKNNPRSNRSSS